MKGSFYVIEGICCAGKTTLGRFLAERFGLRFLSEASEWVKETRPVPLTYEQARENERYFLEIERQRYSQAKKWLNEGKSVIADRDIISTLCIAFGYKQQKKIDTFDELFSDVVDYIKVGYFYPPNLYLYLSVNNQTVEKRNQLRANTLGDFWIGDEILQAHREFYQQFGSVMKNEWMHLENNETYDLDFFEEVFRKSERFGTTLTPSDFILRLVSFQQNVKKGE
jgi:deoxyadenosine/deoxycytidine kinase